MSLCCLYICEYCNHVVLLGAKISLAQLLVSICLLHAIQQFREQSAKLGQNYGQPCVGTLYADWIAPAAG